MLIIQEYHYLTTGNYRVTKRLYIAYILTASGVKPVYRETSMNDLAVKVGVRPYSQLPTIEVTPKMYKSLLALPLYTA